MHRPLSSRKGRLDAVRAISAAVFSVFALAAVLQLLHFSNKPEPIQTPHVEIKDAEVDDERLVHDASVLETDTLVLQPEGPRSVLVVFHRCGHSPLQWWHGTLGCFNCFGLPEQVEIVRTALQHGMGILAIKATSKRKCWDTNHGLDSKDIPHIQAEVKRVESLMGWVGLPRYALGVAEGGAMALLAANFLKFKAVCSMIAGVSPNHLLENPKDEATKESWRYPATVFVHMVKDKTTAAWIEEDVKLLKGQGIPAKEIIVAAQPISEHFLSDRVPGLPSSASSAVFKILKVNKLVDSRGMLTQDPRPHSGVWKDAFKGSHVSNVTLTKLQLLGIQQELNVAYAGHEVTGDAMPEVLNFFSQPASKASSRLTINGVYLPQKRQQFDEKLLP